MASQTPTVKCTTPVGELNWVFITGKGKKDLNDNDKFSASVVLPPEEAKPFTDKVDAFWKENRPAGAKKAKSLGYYPNKVKTDKVDDDGDPIYEEDGNICITFSTATTFPDGKPKVIKTYNAAGNKVNMGDAKIGNGSRGALGGVMAIYTKGGAPGVSLYLDGVQIVEFKEFSDDPGFSAQEGGFESVPNDGGFPVQDSNSSEDEEETKPAKPRL